MLLFAGIALVGTIVSLLVSVLLKHLQPERLAAAHPAGLLMILTTCQIGGIRGLALSGNLWCALASLWLRAAALSIAAPLQSAWLARNLDSAPASIKRFANTISSEVYGKTVNPSFTKTRVASSVACTSG